ncbi:MAG: PolC-type DNA polymerase III [Spirochaetaceae bacterium]
MLPVIAMDASLSVSDITFVAFDFETTGLHPATDRIIELGAVKFQDRAVLGTFDMLVNPGIPMTDAAANVSGITAEMLASKPAIEQALPDFMEFISGAVLVAHNAPFDMSFLRAALEIAGMGDVPNVVIDTQVLAQKAYPRLRSYSLQNLVSELDLTRGNAHRALDDAVMCKDLFLTCAEALSFMGEITLGEVLT